MRIAAIDIGTNSVHMIVVRVRPDLSFEVIDREKAMVRLGAGGLDGKALTTDAMGAALQALSKFKRLAESHSRRQDSRRGDERHARSAQRRRVSLAHRTRDRHSSAGDHRRRGSAADPSGGGVRRGCRQRTSGGHRHRRWKRGDHARDRHLGSGSASFKIGVIRLTERFVKSDPLSGRDERKLTKHILSEIDRHCEQITSIGFDRVIGTSGTILSLGTVATAMSDGAIPSELRNLRVGAKQIRRLRKEVVGLVARAASDGAGTRPAPRRSRRRRRRPARHDPAPSRRRRAHAVRPRAARRPRARLHPAQQQAHRAGRQHPGRAAAQRARTRRALQLLRGARAAGRAARARDLRSDADGARADRSRAGMARVSPHCSTTSARSSATRATIGIRTT